MEDLHVCIRAVSTGLLAATLLTGLAHGQDGPPSLSGTYWATRYNAKIQVVGGGGLPLTAAGKAAYDKNIAGLKDGSIVDEARKFCVPDGVPRVLATPYPFQIFQAPSRIAMIHELNHQIRIITMNKPLPKYEDLVAYPYYNGHSFGRFEGGTLVVETLGFNQKTFLDATGTPHTDEMRTTEHVRKVSPTELEIIVTVHDPDYYTRDWQARFVYNLRNDVRLQDYICGQPHRDLSSVEGVRHR